MSESNYKVIVKANVIVQVEVSRFGGGHTMDEIQKVASTEALEIVQRMAKEYGTEHKLLVHNDVDVFSILVKEAKP